MEKKILAVIYIILIVIMATATGVEKYRGADFVGENIYGSWWFILLWTAGLAFGTLHFLKRKVRRFSVITLHLSFVVILLGALLTHLTAKQGTAHIRQDLPESTYILSDGKGTVAKFPFTITLKKFSVKYYPGTEAPSDYSSAFSVKDEDGTEEDGIVSMNNIFSCKGFRLYQSGYDPDLQGTYLSVNSDPYGIPVTYFGYALLFMSLVWMLIDPKGQFRQALRKSASFASILLLAIAILLPSPASAQTTISESQADQFGHLNILYNDRVCPIQTFAIDFTKKLYGKASYDGKTAEQVLAGFLFYPAEWMKTPIIKIKSGEIKEKFSLQDYASVSDFFGPNGYILGPTLQESMFGGDDKLHKEVASLDDKLMLIMSVQQLHSFKIFPYKGRWYAPADSLPKDMEKERARYFRNAIPMLAGFAEQNNAAAFAEMLGKMYKYQYTYGRDAIPSGLALSAERIYNTVPFATILFMVCLTFGFLSLIRSRWIDVACKSVLALAFASLTLCLALRWIISGTIPMANGYETMIVLAWTIILATLITMRRFGIIVTFGLVLSGFCLLVSHISQLDPQITPVMPVLSSPLLSIHVSIIMIAYALLSLTFISAICAIASRKRAEEMYVMSMIFLYPAMTCLGIGIFVGAIWANVSWGEYWSWDPKETWALITFMIYAVPLHQGSFCGLRRPKNYHIYMLFAFLTVLMTYFGVNYFLSGMHSYA